MGGIRYQTFNREGLATWSGATASSGHFYYQEGETIVFSIGQLKFPPVPAAGRLTLVDLAGTDDPYHPRVKNMAVLVQALDEDRNPENRILIPNRYHRMVRDPALEFDDPGFTGRVVERLDGSEADKKDLARGLAQRADRALDHLANTLEQAAGLSVGPVSGDTDEAGGTATFSVRLNKKPSGPVIIDLASSDPAEGRPAPERLTFNPTNFKRKQTVTVTGVNDPPPGPKDGIREYDIRLAVNAELTRDPDYRLIRPKPVRLRNRDDDSPVLKVGPVLGQASEDGLRAFISVGLGSEPTGSFRVNAEIDPSDSGQITVTPSQIEFTAADLRPGAAPKGFSVSAVDDEQAEGDRFYPVRLTTVPGPENGPPSRQQVKIKAIDNDRAGIRIGPVSGPVTESGGQARFGVALDGPRPASDGYVVKLRVTVDEAADEVEVLDPELVFSSINHREERLVRIRGKDDRIPDGDQCAVLKLKLSLAADSESRPDYGGLGSRYLSVCNLDDDGPAVGFAVEPLSGPTAESDLEGPGGTGKVRSRTRLGVRLIGRPSADRTVTVAAAALHPGRVGLRDYARRFRPVDLRDNALSDRVELTFDATNYRNPQFVQVVGLDDSGHGDRAFGLRLAIDRTKTTDSRYADPQPPGLRPQTLLGVNRDDDGAPRVLIRSEDSRLTDEDGRRARLRVKLNRRPGGTVRVTVQSLNPGEGFIYRPPDDFLTFTNSNFNTEQTVVVQGQGSTTDGSHPYHVRFRVHRMVDGTAYATDSIRDVVLTNLDNDKRLTEDLSDDLGLGEQALYVSEYAHTRAGGRQGKERFGTSVSIHHGRLAVGVPGQDGHGAVYLYVPSTSLDRNGKRSWQLLTRFRIADLMPEGSTAGFERDERNRYQIKSEFGTSVALHGDTLAVGAPNYYSHDDDNAGAVYLFEIVDTELVFKQKLDSRSWKSRFGELVALHGNVLAVGAPEERHYYDDGAYPFFGDGRRQGILPSDLPSTSTGAEPGMVSVFERNDETGQWEIKANIKSVYGGLQRFGGKCTADGLPETARSGNPLAVFGDTLAIGNCRDDSTYTAIDTQKIAGHGDKAEDNSRKHSGAVHVFGREAEGWKFKAYIKLDGPKENDLFGASVALRDNVLIVGAPGRAHPGRADIQKTGAAYVYNHEADSGWAYRGSLSLDFRRGGRPPGDSAKNRYFGAWVGLPFRIGEGGQTSHPIFVGDGTGQIYYRNAWKSDLEGDHLLPEASFDGSSFSARPAGSAEDANPPYSVAAGHGLLVFGEPEHDTPSLVRSEGDPGENTGRVYSRPLPAASP